MRESWPALRAPADQIPGGNGFVAYVAPLAFGSLLGAVLALLIATPLAVSIALFISHYAPRRLAQLLGYLVDLLAAVPSIIYGLWGFQTLAPATVPVARWLEANLGFIPLFAGPASITRPHDAHRRHRPCRDDPADHDGHRARGSSSRRPSCTSRRRWPSERPGGR